MQSLLLHVIVFLALNNYHMPTFFPSLLSCFFQVVLSPGYFLFVFTIIVVTFFFCSTLLMLRGLFYSILFFCFLSSFRMQVILKRIPFIFTYPCYWYAQIYNFIRWHMLNKIQNTVCFDWQCAIQHFRFSLWIENWHSRASENFWALSA